MFVRISIALFTTILFSFQSVLAQLKALTHDDTRNELKIIHSLKNKSSIMLLPFLDDFSTSNIHPDSSIWEANQGTFINNRFCYQPPTFNVATFDGLDEKGQPYNKLSPTSVGYCDSLTCKNIDLFGQLNNSVYLSFYIQEQGLAQPLIYTDTMFLFFKDSSNIWREVWNKPSDTLSEFKFVQIPVNDEFLHDKFQFRFVSYGNKSGMFGVWHIDYVYMNANRPINDSLINDIAISNSISGYLKRYSAMPFDHFSLNGPQEISNSMNVSINSFKNEPLPLSVKATVEVKELTTSTSTILLNNQNYSVPFATRQMEISSLSNDASFIPNQNQSLKVKTTFNLQTGDQKIGDLLLNGTIADFNTLQNDTISSVCIIDDYFAYDDGTAEHAFFMNTQYSTAAQRFYVNKPDTIYAVEINLPANSYQYEGESFTLLIWKKLTDNVEDIIGFQSYLVETVTEKNGFKMLILDEPVAVSDSFFIGYRQTTEDDILIGFDINYSESEPIFMNKTGIWQPYKGPGCLMIRPVTNIKRTLSSNDLIEESKINVYPNPVNSGLFFIENEWFKLFDEVLIYNSLGQEIKDFTLQQHAQKTQLNVPNLSKGIYLLRLRINDAFYSKKIVVE